MLASEASGFSFWLHLLGSALWGKLASWRYPPKRCQWGDSTNSFTRLSVAWEGLACGLLAIIYSKLVRMDFLSVKTMRLQVDQKQKVSWLNECRIRIHWHQASIILEEELQSSKCNPTLKSLPLSQTIHIRFSSVSLSRMSAVAAGRVVCKNGFVPFPQRPHGYRLFEIRHGFRVALHRQSKDDEIIYVYYIGNFFQAPYETHFVDRGHRVSCSVIVVMGGGYYFRNKSAKPESICGYEVWWFSQNSWGVKP
jgi:hypothetical protein